MSEQRQAIEVKGATVKPEELTEQQKLDAEIARVKAKKEGLRVQLLERGSVSSALKVDLPPDKHGEWVRNEPLRIKEKRELGFEIDKEYAPKQAMHDARADGSAVVGDLIHMITDKETKKLIDEIRAEEYLQRHGKPGATNVKQIEERGFLNEQETLVGSHIGSSNESRAVPVSLPVDKKGG